MASIKEVAKKAGVSVSTASRAFREGTSIEPEKKKKILAIASELGYTPNLIARSLKNQKSNLIGIISNIENPFYIEIVKSIEVELRKQGYHIILACSNDDYNQEIYNLRLMAGSRVDGIIFTPQYTKSAAVIKEMYDQGIPMTQMFRTPYNYLDSVVVNDEKGAFLATKSLIENGHKNILLFNVSVSFAPERADGYRKAFAINDIPVDERYIQTVPDANSAKFIHNAMETLQPTAVIAGVYAIGKEVVQYAQRKSLSIPNDFSLIMFDDVEWASMFGISAVAQPVEYLGLSASRLLIDRINNKDLSSEPISLSLDPKLILRNSTKKLTNV